MGKLLIVSFEDNEEDILDSVLAVLGVGRKVFKAESSVKSSKIVLYNLEIDLAGRDVKKSGKVIELTFTEFEILCLLAQQPGRVFSKEQIYDIVWKEPYGGDYCIVASHIRHIREKLEDDPAKPVYIQTVWGSGYRFNPKIGNK